MMQRDLKKAKIALIGFVAEPVIHFIFAFALCLIRFEGLEFNVIGGVLVYIATFTLLVIFGSYKVHQFLQVNQIQSNDDENISRA